MGRSIGAFSKRFRCNSNYIWYHSLGSARQNEIFILWQCRNKEIRFKWFILRLRESARFQVSKELLRENKIKYLLDDRLCKA